MTQVISMRAQGQVSPPKPQSLADLPDGCHQVSHSDYFTDTSCVTNSMVTHALKSGRHYQAYISGEMHKDTPATVFGNVFHTMLLEPEIFDSRYQVFEGDRRYKAGKDEYKALVEAHPSATIISAADFERAQAMCDAVLATSTGRSIIARPGRYEQTYIWTDEDTGVRCKCRVDWDIPGDRVFFDLKSAEDASPGGFQKAAYRHGYHRQAASYLSGTRHSAMGFIVVEKEPPYATSFFEPDAHFLARGLEQWRRGLEVIRDCREARYYPAYSDQFEALSLPSWAAQ